MGYESQRQGNNLDKSGSADSTRRSCWRVYGKIVGLMETVSPLHSRQIYNGQFCQRLSAFRKRAGYKTQADFAADLEIPTATYSKYEERTPLPHYLVSEACDLLDCGAYELFSGLSESLAPPRKPEGVARPCHIGCSLFSLLP